MSRIGKQPIELPAGVEVSIDGQAVRVKGPKGELSWVFLPEVSISQDGNMLKVSQVGSGREAQSRYGLSRTLLNNMVVGVSAGFSKKLEIVGVGYRAALKGRDLELQLGFSHTIEVKAPAEISFEVPTNTQIVVLGIDKQQVGQVAADIRKWRPPEPYKGKGIRYAGEKVRILQSKSAAS